MTPAVGPDPDDEEIDDEVLVIDGPTGVANDPKDPNEQPTDTLANPWKKSLLFLYFSLFL